MEAINIKDTLKINPKKHASLEGTVVLELEGYIDTYNSKSFQQYLNAIMDEGYKNVVIDCALLSYISSTGIGSFTSFKKMLLQKGGELILLKMIPKVYEVFKLLGFLSFFKIFNTPEEVENFLKNKSTGGDSNQPSQDSNQKANSVFPLDGTCPVCSKTLRFSKPGKFRCPGCKNILAVEEDGSIKNI